MTVVYLPFGQPDLMTLEIDEYMTPDLYWNLQIICTDNKVGDTSRFVTRAGEFFCVSSPMQDVGVPLDPRVDADGASRFAKVLFRFSPEHTSLLRETHQGVLAQLDEYIRSQILFRDHMYQSETYNFVETL